MRSTNFADPNPMRISVFLKRFLTVGLIVALVGCESEIDQLGPTVESYYPLQDRAVREYAVIDSILETGGWNVRRFRRRETARLTQQDQLGRTLLRIIVDTASTGTFLEETTHWHVVDDGYAERIEGTERILVLSTPVIRGKTWNGNAYNERGAESFRYTQLDTAVTLQLDAGERTFATSLRVQQRNRVLPELLDNTWEVFAPGVGRILTVNRRLRYNLATGNLEADNTRVVREQLVSTTY
jgi:hypothetical protein